jgi:hypothetical protein
MLTELSSCRNFINVSKTIEILKTIKSNPSSLSELKNFYSNDAVIIPNIEDTFLLLKEMGWIVEAKGIYSLCNLNSELKFESLIDSLLIFIVDNKLTELLNNGRDLLLSIDHLYYAIRNLLLSEDIIKNYPIHNFYLVNSAFVDTFKYLARKKVTKEELLINIEKQNEYGEKAELFVLNYEKKILNNKDSIIHIALEDTSIGYDIQSYLSENSKVHDKFIEVKCYSKTQDKFYISRNETEVSKKLGNNYFLYLVESSFNQNPIIIQNPYKAIFNNKEIKCKIESISYSIKDIVI